MRRVLISGGAGFVGSHVVDRMLREGDHVAVVDDFSTGRAANLRRAAAAGLREEDVLCADICAPECASWIRSWRPDIVMHLAAQASVARSVACAAEDARVNILGTLNVLDAAIQADVSKVVFASSGGTAYGEAPLEARPLSESDVHRPVSPYGLSKATVSRYLALYDQLHGLTSTVLALGNVYGPRQGDGGTTGVVADFVSAIRSGTRPVLYGDGSKCRDFVYVADVADAFARAAEQGDGEVLNIGTGTPTSIGCLLTVVCELMGVGVAAEYRPDQPGEVHFSALDPTRAGRVLGWYPQVSLPEGVDRVIRAATVDD